MLRVRILYAGDDVTDEDAISTLKGMAYSFRVSNSNLTKTGADKRLPGTDSVLTLLHWVEKHMSERKPKPSSNGGPTLTSSQVRNQHICLNRPHIHSIIIYLKGNSDKILVGIF